MKKIDNVFAKLSKLYEFNVNIKKYKIKKNNTDKIDPLDDVSQMIKMFDSKR